MDEYISREGVVSEIKSRIVTANDAWESGYNTAIAEIMEWIKHIPAADVQPVEHGRWESQELAPHLWRFCTLCGFAAPRNYKKYHFCPNCGTRMDGGSE